MLQSHPGPAIERQSSDCASRAASSDLECAARWVTGMETPEKRQVAMTFGNVH